MPKKRRNNSRTLPERQCKKPKTVTNLRKNRDSINYDESGYDLLDYLDESELIEGDDTENIINISQSTNMQSSEEMTEKEKNMVSASVKNVQKKTVYRSKRSGVIEDDNVGCHLRSKSSKRNSNIPISEKFFIVEKIVDMKTIERKRLFYLKWEGFPESENSWEPEANIESKDLIKEYFEELKKNKCGNTTEHFEDENFIDCENEILDTNVECKNDLSVNNDNLNNVNENDYQIANEIQTDKETFSKNEIQTDKETVLKKHSKMRKSRKRCKRLFINKKDMQIVSSSLVNNDNRTNDIPPIVIKKVHIEEKNETTFSINEDKINQIPAKELESVKDVPDSVESEHNGFSKSVTDELMVTEVNEENDNVCETRIEEELNSDESKIVSEKVASVIEERLNSSDCVGSTQSNKENELDSKEKSKDSENQSVENNLEDADESESESEDEYQPSGNEDKSESSDEEFNSESRKKSKTTKSNLNVYFPENLPQNVQEIFQVEKILRMRWNNGIRFFFLKWEGFPDTENSWEPEGNLECPELIEDFLETMKKPVKVKQPKIINKVKRVPPPAPKPLVLETLPDDVKIKEPIVKPKGFPKDREPEVILGSGIVNDELNFLIKWKNIDMANLVSAKRANIECPQTVIRFYENNLMWQNMDGTITTSSADRIIVEEKPVEKKQCKTKCNTVLTGAGPRKVGRPCLQKNVTPNLIQSRKLTSSASRMLNIINNFQMRKSQVTETVTPKPVSVLETLLEPSARDRDTREELVRNNEGNIGYSGCNLREDALRGGVAGVDNVTEKCSNEQTGISGVSEQGVQGAVAQGAVAQGAVTQDAVTQGAVTQGAVAQGAVALGAVAVTHTIQTDIACVTGVLHGPGPLVTSGPVTAVQTQLAIPGHHTTMTTPSKINPQNLQPSLTPTPRRRSKPAKIPKQIKCDQYESIDLTDDHSTSPFSNPVHGSIDGITRQYESRDIPTDPNASSDLNFDFPRPLLQLPMPTPPPYRDLRPKSPYPYHQSQVPLAALDHGQSLFMSPSYPSFTTQPLLVTPSTSNSLAQRVNSSPALTDPRSFQHMITAPANNSHLPQSFANTLQSQSPKLSLKQQFQQNINNTIRTSNNSSPIGIVPQHHLNSNNNNHSHNKTTGIQYQQRLVTPATDNVLQRQTGHGHLHNGLIPPFQLPGPYLQQGGRYISSNNNNTTHYHQSPLTTNEHLLSNQNKTNHVGILYQNSPYSSVPYQYIVNGNNFQSVTNAGNSFQMPLSHQNQAAFYQQEQPNSTSSLRSIQPRKTEFSSPSDQISTMLSPQSQQQTQQSDQLLINSYLNLGAYL